MRVIVMTMMGFAAWGGAAAAGEPLPVVQAGFVETFADGEAALERWVFRGDATATLSMVPAAEGSRAVYIDYRDRAVWRLLSRRVAVLRKGEQYTLYARVRRNLGFGMVRMIAETTDPDAPEILAQLDVIDRENRLHDLRIVFRASADAEIRIGFDADGYSELWVEEIGLQHNDPPVSGYTTGMLLSARSPTDQARYRTGVFLEAEELAGDSDAVSNADTDGDGVWARCSVDAAANPWLFSENTVIKSDSLSAEEGGRMPPLELVARGLIPGLYQAFLSDPQRDAAISVSGGEWRRVTGGEGEIALGLLDVTGDLSVRVAHRFRTEANPGPIYVDYLRFMPVYDVGRPPERPGTVAAGAVPAAVNRGVLRLLQTRGVARAGERVVAGMPFARGALRPGDGFRLEGVSEPAILPLVHWPDGSIKWLRVRFRVDSPAGGMDLPVAYGRDVSGVPDVIASAPEPGPDAGGVYRCGAIEVTVRDGTWERLSLGGNPLFSEPPTVTLRTASGTSARGLSVESVSLARPDGVPGMFVDGHATAPDGSGLPFSFRFLLTEPAPGTLGLRFHILNESDETYQPDMGCGPAVPLTELSLSLNGLGVQASELRWSAGVVPWDGRPQVLEQGGTGGCVEEFRGQWRLRAGADTRATGDVTEGRVDIRGPGGALCVGVREFVERCPSELSVRANGGGLSLGVGLLPPADERVLRFAQGTRLGAELALVPHDGSLPEEDLGGRLAAVTDPLIAVPGPGAAAATGVFGPVATHPDPRFRGYTEGAEHLLRVLRGRHMRYGLEDWGDIFERCGYVRTDTKLWTNMEWNFIAALVAEFVRTGDAGFLTGAVQAGRHFVDADVAHVSSNPAWVGGSYVHTGDTREGHQVDPPDFAHAGWTEGLVWLYCMTGDERLRDTSVGLADYIVRNMPPEGAYRSEPPFSMWNCCRQAGNPILTLATVAELDPEPARVRALQRIVDYAVRTQDPKLGCWSTPCYEDPVYHRPSPYWGAMLLRGLHLYWEQTGDERVARAFRRLGDFYLEDHPAETRRELKPGSYYRTNFYFRSEACAFASLYADDAETLIAKGLEPLAEVFPASGAPELDARVVAGALSGACRLAGAAAAVARRPGAEP